jgi:hypothetical protein
MKNVLFFSALLLVVTSNLFAGEIASKDTVNGWYFWKAEGANQDSAWTHLTDSAISGKSSQVFGFRSFGLTKYFWIKKLDRKYKSPNPVQISAILDTLSTRRTDNHLIVEVYLGNSDTASNLYLIERGGFSFIDRGIPVEIVNLYKAPIDSVDIIVFSFSSSLLSEKVAAELKTDKILFDWTTLVDDGGEPKFPQLKTTKSKINFGLVAQGVKKIDSVLVTNTGDAPLVISSIWTDDARFSVKCSITTISPKASTNVVVEFTQDSVSGVKKGKLLVEHNGLSKLDSIELIADFMTSVGDENQLPNEFSLSQNYPNPFNPSTTIKYSVESKQLVRITVYDLLGKEVAVLVDGEVGAGEHSVVFNAKNLSSGVYLYRIQAGNFVVTKRMTLLK